MPDLRAALPGRRDYQHQKGAPRDHQGQDQYQAMPAADDAELRLLDLHESLPGAALRPACRPGELRKTGRILGKDTDDLEGYDWPLDARHYGPGVTPHIPDTVVRPPGYHFDAARTEPPTTKDNA